MFECLLHPARYRTSLCKDGETCGRRACFFAHHRAELRKGTDPWVPVGVSVAVCGTVVGGAGTVSSHDERRVVLGTDQTGTRDARDDSNCFDSSKPGGTGPNSYATYLPGRGNSLDLNTLDYVSAFRGGNHEPGGGVVQKPGYRASPRRSAIDGGSRPERFHFFVGLHDSRSGGSTPYSASDAVGFESPSSSPGGSSFGNAASGSGSLSASGSERDCVSYEQTVAAERRAEGRETKFGKFQQFQRVSSQPSRNGYRNGVSTLFGGNVGDGGASSEVLSGGVGGVGVERWGVGMGNQSANASAANEHGLHDAGGLLPVSSRSFDAEVFNGKGWMEPPNTGGPSLFSSMQTRLGLNGKPARDAHRGRQNGLAGDNNLPAAPPSRTSSFQHLSMIEGVLGDESFLFGADEGLHVTVYD